CPSNAADPLPTCRPSRYHSFSPPLLSHHQPFPRPALPTTSPSHHHSLPRLSVRTVPGGAFGMKAQSDPARRTWRIARAPGRLPLAGHALHLARRPLEYLTSLPALGDLVQLRLG